MPDERAPAQGRRKLGEVRRGARDHTLAVGAGPLAACHGERDRPGCQVARSALDRLDLDLLGDRAARDDLPPLLVETLHHGA